MACPALGMRTGDKSFISGWVEDVQCTAQPGHHGLSSRTVAKTDFAACESESESMYGTYTYIHTYIHTYVHTYTYTHVHARHTRVYLYM